MINEKQFRSLIIRPVGFVRQTFFLPGFSPWNLLKALRTLGKGLVQIRQQNYRNTERGGKGKYDAAITSHQLRMSVNALSHFGQSRSRGFCKLENSRHVFSPLYVHRKIPTTSVGIFHQILLRNLSQGKVSSNLAKLILIKVYSGGSSA